jgi:hypothetical protein
MSRRRFLKSLTFRSGDDGRPSVLTVSDKLPTVVLIKMHRGRHRKRTPDHSENGNWTVRSSSFNLYRRKLDNYWTEAARK